MVKAKNLVIEDFYGTENVRLFNLNSIEENPRIVAMDCDNYKLKKANPAEQLVIADIKRCVNQIIAKRKVEHRQLQQQQELETQIKQLEDRLANIREENRTVYQDVQQLLHQRKQIVNDHIRSQRFKDPNRELIHYDFYDSKSGNADEATATYLVRHTDKPIHLREGFAYRGAKLKKVSRECALDAIQKNWSKIVEHEDRVEINTFSGNDMW